MIITKIYIEQFSNLKDVTLTLDEKPFHLLTGPNETGKSGLHDFLIACLYGAGNQNKQNIAASLRTLRMPWGENFMAGYIEYENRGRRYQYSMSLGTARRRDLFRLIDLETNEEVDLGGKMLGEFLFEIPRTVFEQTACIRQMNVAFAGTSNFDELRTRLASLADTGDSDISYDKLRKSWDEEYKNLTAQGRKKAVIPKLTEQLNDLLHDQDIARAARDRENDMQIRIRDLATENQAATEAATVLRQRRETIEDVLLYDRFHRIAADEEDCTREWEALLEEDKMQRGKPLYFDSDSYRTVAANTEDLKADIDEWTDQVRQWHYRREEWRRSETRLAQFDQDKASQFLEKMKQIESLRKQSAATESTLNTRKQALAAINRERDARIDAVAKREAKIRAQQLEVERDRHLQHNAEQAELSRLRAQLVKQETVADSIERTIHAMETKLDSFAVKEEQAVSAIRETFADWYRLENRDRMAAFMAQDEALRKHDDLLTGVLSEGNVNADVPECDLADSEFEHCRDSLEHYNKELAKAMAARELRESDIDKDKSKLAKYRETASEKRRVFAKSVRDNKMCAIFMSIMAVAVLIGAYFVRPVFMWASLIPVILAGICCFRMQRAKQSLARIDQTESELEQEIRELEQAAEEDERTTELRGRIDQLERRFDTLLKARNQLRKSSDEKAWSLSRKVSEYDTDIATRENLRRELHTTQKQYDECTETVGSLRRQVSDLEAVMRAKAAEHDEHDQVIEAAIQKLSEEKSALEESFVTGDEGRQISALQTEIAELNEKANAIKNLIEKGSDIVKQLVLTSGCHDEETYKDAIDKNLAEIGIHAENRNTLHDTFARLQTAGENLVLRLDRLQNEAQLEPAKDEDNAAEDPEKDDRFAFAAAKIKRQSAYIADNLDIIVRAIADEAKRYDTRKIRMENVKQRLADVKRRAEASDPQTILKSIREKYREAEETDPSLLAMLAALQKDTLQLEPRERMDLARRVEQLAEDSEKLNKEIGERKLEIARLSSEAKHIFAVIDIPETIEQKIRFVRRQLVEAEQRAQDLRLAIEILDDAYSELKRQFSPRLRELTQKYLAILTNGHYQEVYVDSDMQIKTRYVGSGQIREADYLSGGTTDQVYLALRLAISELLAGDKRVPLILDDIFVQYDDGRLRNGLQLLNEYGIEQQRQIILMTCQERVAEALPDISKWQRINLTDAFA